MNSEGQTFSIKIFEAQKAEGITLKQGTVETDNKNYLRIGTGDGTIEITDLQMAGKKRMAVADFLKGFHAGKNLKAQ